MKVETITVGQFEDMLTRLQSDGATPHFAGPCLIINMPHDSAVSIMHCPDGIHDGNNFNYTVAYVSPHAIPLQALLNVVGLEN